MVGRYWRQDAMIVVCNSRRKSYYGKTNNENFSDDVLGQVEGPRILSYNWKASWREKLLLDAEI
jgi:hypothetical protein